MSSEHHRLVEALQLVRSAMASPNTFENSKEATFSALRRGCLDLRKHIERLDEDYFSTDDIEDAWLFLIELSKAKLRRKHALECINVMMSSPKWVNVLKTSFAVREKVPSITRDMQVALGFTKADTDYPLISPKQSQPISPPVKRTNSTARPVANARTTLGGSKVKVEKVLSPPATASQMTPVVPPTQTSELNPFRLDFNPFGQFRGSGLRSNPHSRKPGGYWWEDPKPGPLPTPWW